jgi:hypothetical protein
MQELRIEFYFQPESNQIEENKNDRHQAYGLYCQRSAQVQCHPYYFIVLYCPSKRILYFRDFL